MSDRYYLDHKEKILAFLFTRRKAKIRKRWAGSPVAQMLGMPLKFLMGFGVAETFYVPDVDLDGKKPR